MAQQEYTCQCRRCQFNPWVGKIPWRRKRQPTSVFLPGKFRKQRSLTGYSPWGHKELDTPEPLNSSPATMPFLHKGFGHSRILVTAGRVLEPVPPRGDWGTTIYHNESISGIQRRLVKIQIIQKCINKRGFPGGSAVKNPPAMQES